MATSRQSVAQPSQKTSGDDVLDEDKTTASPGRGPRTDDNSSAIPNRQLNIRSR
jgi:hypothetical protein